MTQATPLIQNPDGASLVKERGESLAASSLINTIEEGEITFIVRREGIAAFLKALRDDSTLAFTFFIDVTGADYSKYSEGAPERFGVIYTLVSPKLGQRIHIQTYLPESDPRVDSASNLFTGANWGEREVFDMYGIVFKGHPDLKRILMPDEYEGHPLRKDYPLKGRGERASFPVYTATRGHS